MSSQFQFSLFIYSFMIVLAIGLSITAVHTISTGGHKSIVNEGENALLPCILNKSYLNDTILWRKASTKEILTAATNRVTKDARINVLHDKSFNPHPTQKQRDEDVWVLSIKNTLLTDSDVYVCEVNSVPARRSFHTLEIVAKNVTNDIVTSLDSSTGIPLTEAMQPAIVTAIPSSSNRKDTLMSMKSTKNNTYFATMSTKMYEQAVEIATTPADLTLPPSSARPSKHIKVFWSFPNADQSSATSASNGLNWPIPSLPHDFTDCCRSVNVSLKCMHYCSVHTMFKSDIDGMSANYPINAAAATDADSCIHDFEHIVKCTAGGRNHVPCCQRSNIPDMCQDLCEGNYTPFNDYIKSHKTCGNYTFALLSCIIEGIHTIPSEPKNVHVESINEKSVQVFWQPPDELAAYVQNYTVNVTKLHSFDQNYLGDLSASVLSLTVDQRTHTALVNNLLPFTMYEVSVIASNFHGSSLPSLRVRTLTLESNGGNGAQINGAGGVSASDGDGGGAIVPVLPDVRGCCMKHGMTHVTCLDRMCDPKQINKITDLMLCAQYANISFGCLANNIDHTPCCISRGIPNDCLSFCAGTVTSITFSSFKCLQYMSDFSSCLLQNYGVLAGPPSKVKILLTSTTYAILSWTEPKILPDTVTKYHVYLRRLNYRGDGNGEDNTDGDGDDNGYSVMVKEREPVIIENLDANIYYEVFVVSINVHGKGTPSPRIVFQTKSEQIDDSSTSAAILTNNMTACCDVHKMLPPCMPLCTLNMKLSDLEDLYGICQPQLGIIAKCAGGNRDHTACCIRRSVPNSCLPYCRGILPREPVDCLALYGGNIIQCYDEVENLHATFVTNSSISLEWISSTQLVARHEQLQQQEQLTLSPSSLTTASSSTPSPQLNGSGNIVTDVVRTIDFLVQYGKMDNLMTATTTKLNDTIVQMENEINTTETEIELRNLSANTLYAISVIARSDYGTSLPTSLLLINTTNEANKFGKTDMYGSPSPPHSLTASSISATWLVISWQPPVFHPMHEAVSYRIHHKSFKDDKFSVIETRLLWTRFDNLKPNSQYVFYVIAVNGKSGQISLPSERNVVWTDPAVAAVVDPPNIHPTEIITEGSPMTILCVALGVPTPKISLYIGGELIKEETTRQMVTVIANVTRYMDLVLCYADNGYGVPMQLSKKIQINFAPHIDAVDFIMATPGMRVDIKCMVNAKPLPQVIFWRDHDGRVPVILGNNYRVKIDNMTTDDGEYSSPIGIAMKLTIDHIADEQFGDYFCHAENVLGSATHLISLRVKQPSPSSIDTNNTRNITACCINESVSVTCMSACGIFVDFDLVKNRAECLIDFDRLMKCAADGLPLDYQSCCANANVPHRCLHWCRGEGIVAAEKDICALQYAKTIIDCFQSDRERLPGIPQDVQVRATIDEGVLITWKMPTQNADNVNGYRVYWQEMVENATNPIDDSMSQINGIGTDFVETTDLQVRTENLRSSVMYKIMVKAANQYGSSDATKPIEFRFTHNRIYSPLYGRSRSRTYLGIFGIILFIVIFVIVAMKLYKRRSTSKSITNGVAFENPSYMREINIEHIPVQMTDVNITDLTPNWHQERLQLPSTLGTSTSSAMTALASNYETVAASTRYNAIARSSTTSSISVMTAETEVKPSLYEELKLGHEGAGFKRLV